MYLVGAHTALPNSISNNYRPVGKFSYIYPVAGLGHRAAGPRMIMKVII